MEKKIGIACDHAAYDLKEFLVGYLSTKGFEVKDSVATRRSLLTILTLRTHWLMLSSQVSSNEALVFVAQARVSL